jgi:hypothetical protein
VKYLFIKAHQLQFSTISPCRSMPACDDVTGVIIQISSSPFAKALDAMMRRATVGAGVVSMSSSYHTKTNL